MSKSEIFNNFVKISQEKGLISADKSFKQLEKNHRASSSTIDDLEKLYHVRPDSPKKMNYKNNIMEIAHTTPQVISSAYDNLNGLVENNMERQNILLNIVNKRNNGLLIQKKYAEKELMLSLVRIANDLDNKNSEELRVLADSCIEQVHSKKKQLNKFAFPWLTIGIVSTVIGGIWAWQHLRDTANGYKNSSDSLKEKILDALSSAPNLGWGAKATGELRTSLQGLLRLIQEFDSIYKQNYEAVSEIGKPRTREQLEELAQKGLADDYTKIRQQVETAYLNMKPFLETIKDNLDTYSYKSNAIEDSKKGIIERLIDSTKVLRGDFGIFSDRYEAIANAIPPYQGAIEQLIQILNRGLDMQLEAQRKLAENPALIEQPSVDPSLGLATTSPMPGLDFTSSIPGLGVTSPMPGIGPTPSLSGLGPVSSVGVRPNAALRGKPTGKPKPPTPRGVDLQSDSPFDYGVLTSY